MATSWIRLARSGERTGRLLAFGVVVIVVASQIAAHLFVHLSFDNLTAEVELALEVIILASIDGFLVWRVVIAPLERRRSLADFDARLGRAFEMAPNEQACYDVIERVFAGVANTRRAEVLVADSSDAHLKSAAAVGSSEGCQVVAPHNCPAVRRSQTLVFGSSEELDSCPELRDRPGCSAICVPVNIMGKAVGVLHVVGDAHAAPVQQVARLESLANQAGTRIGMMRVMDRTSVQASLDPLTGLLNRRAFENQAYSLVDRGRSFAVAMGDLDHFKQVNDVHGHEIGDRALRAFARAMQEALRAEDLVCRYGGEEFVILLPGIRAAGAVPLLERVQRQLHEMSNSGSFPPFTVSFGVAESDLTTDLNEVIRAADLALLRSKREGRNRITVSDAPHTLAAVPSAVAV